MGIFALVDAHNFYVSCERVFQPHLEGRPVAVLSNNDGCVIARSNEVKALGCPMGAPFFKVKDLFKKHQVQVFSSNYALYGDMSARMMQTLLHCHSQCEIYSIDEAFLYFDTLQDWEERGRFMQKRLLQWLGLPVGIGFGKTKTLAKAANRLAKANPATYEGICVLTDKNCDSSLKNLPLEDLWGIGQRHAKSLYAMGLKTAYDYKYVSPERIKKQVKTPGLQLQQELQGLCCHKLVYEAPDKKSICSSKSFGKRLHCLDAISAALLANTTIAYHKLRTQGLVASHMMVFIHSSRFDSAPVFKQCCLSLATVPFTALSFGEAALSALKQCFQKGPRYHKSGVLLLGLRPKTQEQASLFAEPDTASGAASSALDQALTTLQARYGSTSIQTASLSFYQPSYGLKTEQRSPRYTSRWDELLSVSS